MKKKKRKRGGSRKKGGKIRCQPCVFALKGTAEGPKHLFPCSLFIGGKGKERVGTVREVCQRRNWSEPALKKNGQEIGRCAL